MTTKVQQFNEIVHRLPDTITGFIQNVDDKDDWDSALEIIENMQEARDLSLDLFTLCSLLVSSTRDDQMEMVGMLSSEIDDAIELSGIAEMIDGLVLKASISFLVSIFKKKVNPNQLGIVSRMLASGD